MSPLRAGKIIFLMSEKTCVVFQCRLPIEAYGGER